MEIFGEGIQDFDFMKNDEEDGDEVSVYESVLVRFVCFVFLGSIAPKTTFLSCFVSSFVSPK